MQNAAEMQKQLLKNRAIMTAEEAFSANHLSFQTPRLGRKSHFRVETAIIKPMTTMQVLVAELGGEDRLARLERMYQKARPRRGRWGPGILTADEVFRQTAKDEGFTEEGIALFIDHIRS